MFDNIAYLDESSEWIDSDLNKAERFFFLNMKCFRFKIDQVYHRDQFHFATDGHILRVNFTEYAKDEFVFFLTKSKETSDISKIIILDYLSIFSPKKHLVTHQTSLYEYEDRFSFIWRHFSSPPPRDDSDLNGQLLGLQSNEHNLRTLNLPMEEEDLESVVDEDLFEQLYCSSAKRMKRTISNYKQLFVSNYLRSAYFSQSDFSFNLIFLQKVVTSTNEETYGKLILSLLNVLSI